MVTITKYPDQLVPLFSPDGKFIDNINWHELGDVQRQICEQDLSGYYIMFKRQKIDIDSDGNIGQWPTGMFDTTQIVYGQLYRARKAKKDKKQI